MPTRLAAVSALLVFTMCLVIGTYFADNPFSTTVTRALAAMAGTFVIGLIVGAMGQKMVQESVDVEGKKQK